MDGRISQMAAGVLALAAVGCASTPDSSEGESVRAEPPPDAREHRPLPEGPEVALSGDVPPRGGESEASSAGRPVEAERMSGRGSERAGEMDRPREDEGAAGGAEGESSRVQDRDDPRAGPRASAAEGAEVVSRSRIASLVERGPAYILRAVRVEPVRSDGAFEGFEIVAATPAARRAMQPQLQVGDVVDRINDETIERPDDYLEVWKALTELSKVTVHFRRDGRRGRAVWVVRD